MRGSLKLIELIQNIIYAFGILPVVIAILWMQHDEAEAHGWLHGQGLVFSLVAGQAIIFFVIAWITEMNINLTLIIFGILNWLIVAGKFAERRPARNSDVDGQPTIRKIAE